MNTAAPTKTQCLSTPNSTDTIHLKQIGDFEDKPRWNLTQVYADNSQEFSSKRLTLASLTDRSDVRKINYVEKSINGSIESQSPKTSNN